MFWWEEAKCRRDTLTTSCCTCPFEYCRVQVPRPDKVRRLFVSRTDLQTSTPLGLQIKEKQIWNTRIIDLDQNDQTQS